MGSVPLITGPFCSDRNRGFDPVLLSNAAEVMHLLPSSVRHRLRLQWCMECRSTVSWIIKTNKKKRFLSVTDKWLSRLKHGWKSFACSSRIEIWLRSILPMSNGLESITIGHNVVFVNFFLIMMGSCYAITRGSQLLPLASFPKLCCSL